MVASLSWFSVCPNTLTARPGETFSTSMVSRPEMNSSVPAALAQLKLNVALVGASPSALRTFRPGHSNAWVRSASAVLMNPIWAIEKTAMMMM